MTLIISLLYSSDMARQHYGGGTNKCRVWFINRSATRLKSKGQEGTAVPVTTSTKERDSSSVIYPTTATTGSTIPHSSKSMFGRLNWDDNLCRLVLQEGPSFSSEVEISNFSDNNDDDDISSAVGKDEKMKQQWQSENISPTNTRSFYGKTTSSAVVLFEMTPPTSTALHRHQRRQSFCKWLDSINKCSSQKTKEQSQEHQGIVIQESSKKSVKRKLQLLNSQGNSQLKKSTNGLTRRNLKETSSVGAVVQNNDSNDFTEAIGLIKQPSSHTSLSLAKAYFDYLDKTNLQTVAVDEEETTSDSSTTNKDAPANNSITIRRTVPSTRTRRTINYQCPTLKNEYKAYHDSALSCGIEPLSIREFACQRWKHFHKEGFFDGFFDE